MEIRECRWLHGYHCLCAGSRQGHKHICKTKTKKKINFWLKTKLEIEKMWCSMSPSKLHCLEAGKKAYCLDGISWNITPTSGVLLYFLEHNTCQWCGSVDVVRLSPHVGETASGRRRQTRQGSSSLDLRCPLTLYPKSPNANAAGFRLTSSTNSGIRNRTHDMTMKQPARCRARRRPRPPLITSSRRLSTSSFPSGNASKNFFRGA